MCIDVIIFNAAISAFFECYVVVHKQYVLAVLLVSDGVSIPSVLGCAAELPCVWSEEDPILCFSSRRIDPWISVGCNRQTGFA